ncbi:MAG: hypothetical protein HFH85_05800 [Lachnospiraceae bacterium]|jgi:hypothetical protein|nr:hypothetical protein [Lachnospiraceae bacterium]
MKRFSKMLALGLAAVLVFGMTAQAEGSSSTENNAPVVEGEDLGGATKNEVKEETRTAVTTTVTSAATVQAVKNATGGTNRSQTVKTVIDLTIPEGGATVTVAVAGAKMYQTFIVAHMTDDGSAVKELISAKCTKDGFVTFTAKSGSPFAIIQVGDDSEITTAAPTTTETTPGTAPKTGETIPVAGVLAVLFMAGVIVCANKVRYNK